MIIPKTLIALREAKNWTQQRLHEESGVEETVISSIEAGEVPYPNSDTVDRMAKALNVTPLDLSRNLLKATPRPPPPSRPRSLKNGSITAASFGKSNV